MTPEQRLRELADELDRDRPLAVHIDYMEAAEEFRALADLIEAARGVAATRHASCPGLEMLWAALATLDAMEKGGS